MGRFVAEEPFWLLFPDALIRASVVRGLDNRTSAEWCEALLLAQAGLRVHQARSEDDDAIRRAAILAVGLVQERPFEDGNLPTAFAARESDLQTNGYAFIIGVERRIGQFLRVVEEDYDDATAI